MLHQRAPPSVLSIRSTRPLRSAVVLSHRGSGHHHDDAAVSRTFRALDALLRTLQRLLSAGDMFGGIGGGAQPQLTQSQPGVEPAVGVTRPAGRSKWLRFTSDASTHRSVAQRPSGKLLSEYLCLPAEEYALLDPSWVCRVSPTAFLVTVPLAEVVGELLQGAAAVPPALAKLRPALRVTTAAEPAARRVVLTGDEASSGDASLDERFSLSFTVAVSWSGGPSSEWAEAAAAAAAERSHEAASSADGGAARSDAERAQEPATAAAAHKWKVRCRVRTKGELLLPPPLSSLPGFMLNTAAGLAATGVSQALLPNFARLLADDYAAWADETPRSDAAPSRRGGGGLLASRSARRLPPSAGDDATVVDVETWETGVGELHPSAPVDGVVAVDVEADGDGAPLALNGDGVAVSSELHPRVPPVKVVE